MIRPSHLAASPYGSSFAVTGLALSLATGASNSSDPLPTALSAVCAASPARRHRAAQAQTVSSSVT